MADEDKQLVAVAQAIKKMNEQWLHEVEMIRMVCKIVKARYDGFIAAGFTAEQALVLCLKRTEL